MAQASATKAWKAVTVFSHRKEIRRKRLMRLKKHSMRWRSLLSAQVMGWRGRGWGSA
jgi:hypothetical protein